MPSTWTATTSQGRMIGDYISTSYGSDGLAHGVFATAGRQRVRAGSAVLFSGDGGVDANNLWNVVDNNGAKHRD